MQDEDKQFTLDDLEREIQRELNLPEAYGLEPPPDPRDEEMQAHAARKPFRINDFDSPRDKEMAVFTHAKKLAEYVFVATEKSPKKYRWSIITRLQNSAVEVVEYLYRANFERDDEGARRIEYQKRAAVALSILDFYTETARTKQALNIRQVAVIARQIAETRKLLNGWVRSTKRKQ